jgi:drug/metabolite transporter (DMT)-like permease
VTRPGWGTVSAESLLGDTLTLINAASFALFLVISRPLLARLDPLVATTALFAFGSLAMAVLGLPELRTIEPAAVSPHIWWLGAFIVLMPTVGAYVIQAWALARVESSVVAFFIFLQPVIATGLSVVLLGERPGWPVLVGALLIFAGVGITLSRSRRAGRDQEAGSPGCSG